MSEHTIHDVMRMLSEREARIRDLEAEVDKWRDKYRATDNNWNNEVDELMERAEALQAKLEAIRHALDCSHYGLGDATVGVINDILRGESEET